MRKLGNCADIWVRFWRVPCEGWERASSAALYERAQFRERYVSESTGQRATKRATEFACPPALVRTALSDKMPSNSQLLKIRVFRLGLLQDGDVGVGVFPGREEILIGSHRGATVSLRKGDAAGHVSALGLKAITNWIDCSVRRV